MKVGSNTAVFILFFGIALLDAFQEGNWIRAVLWLAVGVVFLFADNTKSKSKGN